MWLIDLGSAAENVEAHAVTVELRRKPALAV
jgi:hypothetical protein